MHPVPILFNLYSEMLIKEAVDESTGQRSMGRKSQQLDTRTTQLWCGTHTRHSTTNDGQNQFGMQKLRNEIKCEENKGDDLKEGQ